MIVLPEKLASTISGLRCGLEHVIAVDGGGQVYTWGDNDSGQLGVGNFAATNKPHHVHLPMAIRQVAAGQSFSLALSDDRRHLFSWGDNSKGQLGLSRDDGSRRPREMKLPLRAGQTIRTIITGGNGAFALLSDGDVYGWGANDHGQAGQDPSTPIIATPTRIAGLSNVATIAAGDHQTLALKSDGSVWALGANRYGQLGPGGPRPKVRSATSTPVRVSGLPEIKSIAAGGESSFALDTTGHVWSWGRNAFGQLGLGTVDTADGPHAKPTRVEGLSHIVSIEAQGPFTLAADASGNIYGWGFDQNGEVGDGKLQNTGMPRLVLTADKLGQPVVLAAGHWFAYAYNPSTGRAFAWGRNSYGELTIPRRMRNDPLPLDLGRVLPLCFAGGTRIRTARGEIPVERLRVGDRAATVGGAHRSIRRLGRRTVRPAEYRQPHDMSPVRILAGAFGGGLPCRDLFLSPGHPVLVDADEDGSGGLLVPIMCLVNGTTVSRVLVDEVTYWHVELDAHDLLLAEGLPAESYIDGGDRGFFAVGAAGGDHPLAHPDLVLPGLRGRCRPVAIAGASVDAERRRLDTIFAARLAAACAWPESRALA